MKIYLKIAITYVLIIIRISSLSGQEPDTLRISSLLGDKPDTLAIEEIIISGKQSPDIYSDLARIVYTITPEIIRSMPATSIQDILEYVTALDIRQRGSHGVQADISMRGGSFEQVLILLNGVRINNPQTGHHNLNIPVTAADIQRIEILEGPGSRIYGPNAFSGAVNIITKDPGDNNFFGHVKGGEYGYLDLFASGGFQTGSVENYISIGNSSSHGFAENTDFKTSNVFYRGLTDAGYGILDFQAGYLNKSYGANSFYSALYPEQYEKIESTFTNLTFKSGGRIKYNQSVYWKRLLDRFELFRYDKAPWYEGHNFHKTDIYGTNAVLNIPYSLGNIYLGSEIRNETILSSVLGEQLETPKEVKNQSGAFYNYYKKREQVNITAGSSLIKNRFSVSSGILLSKTSSDRWGVYGGIDMSIRVNKHINWFYSWNQSLRIPSFTEMYYSGPVHNGNPYLIPEEANTIETGLRLPGGDWRGCIAVFRRKGKNIIDWAKKDNELIWESRNITQINTYGFELELVWVRPEGLKFPVKEVRTGYSFLDISKQSENYISAYALDHLNHKIVTGLTIPLFPSASLVLMTVYQDRAGTYTNVHSGAEVSYTPFLLVDIGSTFQLSEGLYFSLDVSNLFNTGYTDIGNVPLPGRWIKGGINLSLSGKSS